MLVLVLAGGIAYLVIPRHDPQPLPPGLVALSSPQGQLLLRRASARDDYPELSAHFETQKLRSFCGVASSVIVLRSLGRDVTQVTLVNARAEAVRPLWRIAFGGMTLAQLAGILAANDVEVTRRHADRATLDQFRTAVRRNLASDDDYLVVNYQRAQLGQPRRGHISPIAAYDRQGDSVLLLDTADYRYPPTWIPLPALYRAMGEIDKDSGRSRGWVEVAPR